MNKPDFEEDLNFAQDYERRIAKHYGATISKDRRWDIEIKNKKIELKIDRYFNSKNFFIEMVSDINSGKLGGPYRSQADEVDEFWYIFVDEDNAVVYKWATEDLIEELDGIRGWEKLVRNKNWTTRGKLIKRSALDCEPEEIVLC